MSTCKLTACIQHVSEPTILRNKTSETNYSKTIRQTGHWQWHNSLDNVSLSISGL